MSQKRGLEVVILPLIRRVLYLPHNSVSDILLEGDDEVVELGGVLRDVGDDELLLCEVEPEPGVVDVEQGQLESHCSDGVLAFRHIRGSPLLVLAD